MNYDGKKAPGSATGFSLLRFIRRAFPAITGRSLLRHYLPLSGVLGHTMFTVSIFSPSIYTRLFTVYDLAASNVMLFNAHLGIGFYVFFRPHMFHLWRWRRVEFSVFASVMFNFGSILLSIFIKGLLPKNMEILPRTAIAFALSIFMLSCGLRYTQYIDHRTIPFKEFNFVVANSQTAASLES